MCGIVGAVSTRNIVPILVEGLSRLEYRGYDSCGVAVHQDGELRRARSTARVAELERKVAADDIAERHRHRPHALGDARRAGGAQRAPALLARPAARARPTAARRRGSAAAGRIALVHNGIIENHDELRAELQAQGYVFESQTDTEVIAHLVDHLYDGDLLEAVQRALPRLRGAYAIAVFCRDEPHRVVGARQARRWCSASARAGRRELPRLRRDGAGRRDRPDRLPRGRRRRRPAARQALDQPRRRRAATSSARRSARCAPCVAHSGAAELGPVPALHAEGDLRAAERDRRHAGRRAAASRPSCSATAPTASSRRSTRC